MSKMHKNTGNHSEPLITLKNDNLFSDFNLTLLKYVNCDDEWKIVKLLENYFNIGMSGGVFKID